MSAENVNSAKPYASIDLSNINDVIDGIPKIEIKIPSAAEGKTASGSSKGASNRKYLDIAKKFFNENADAKMPPSFTVGKGFTQTSLDTLESFKDKQISIDELRQHIDIPGLDEKLKDAKQKSGKLKIVIMKKKKNDEKDVTASGKNKKFRYVLPQSNAKVRRIRKKKPVTAEFLAEPLAQTDSTPLWSVEDNHWDFVKNNLKEYLRGIPYDPKKKFSQHLTDFLNSGFKSTSLLHCDQKPPVQNHFMKYGIVCVVMKCKNLFYRNGANWDRMSAEKSFFSFPQDREMALKWIKLMHKPALSDLPHEELLRYRICQDHFLDDDFQDEEKTELKMTAIPIVPELRRTSKQKRYYYPGYGTGKPGFPPRLKKSTKKEGKQEPASKSDTEALESFQGAEMGELDEIDEPMEEQLKRHTVENYNVKDSVLVMDNIQPVYFMETESTEEVVLDGDDLILPILDENRPSC